LIGLLKEKTSPALDALRSYFPPVDPKTGRTMAFKNSQLSGISIGNAIEVKKQAVYASAVLTAQLMLEPAMDSVDKALLVSQLSMVNRIRSRASTLEPLAQSAKLREQLAQAHTQEQQNKANEKARRDAALAEARKLARAGN
jgi:hypothetical protein